MRPGVGVEKNSFELDRTAVCFILRSAQHQSTLCTAREFGLCFPSDNSTVGCTEHNVLRFLPFFFASHRQLRLDQRWWALECTRICTTRWTLLEASWSQKPFPPRLSWMSADRGCARGAMPPSPVKKGSVELPFAHPGLAFD